MSLNDYIAKAISGTDGVGTDDLPISEDPGTVEDLTVEVEKLASALDFIASQGVAELVKHAGTNEGERYPTNQYAQVGASWASPPVDTTPSGLPRDNSSAGFPRNSDLPKSEARTTHPGLASAESVAGLSGSAGHNMQAPGLGSLLRAKPFNDPRVSEQLSHGGGGTKTAEIRAELIRRIESARSST